MSTTYIATAITVVGILTAIGTAYYAGHQAGVNSQISDQKSIDDAIGDIRAAASEGAASAISSIEFKQITIHNKLEREIRTNTVYTDCKHTPDGLQLINEALSNGANKPVSDSKLP